MRLHSFEPMDSKYYRHFKGMYYMLLSEAKDSETLEDFVVYRALNNNSQTLVSAKSKFNDYVSEEDYTGLAFTPVSKSEVLRAVKECFWFPDIEYTNVYFPLSPDSFSSRVRGMVTLLKRLGEIPQGWNECTNDDELEAYIIEIINKYNQGDSLRDIFNFIQIWGGMSGRNIYIDGLDWCRIEPHYRSLVNVCLSISENLESERDRLIEAIEDFNKNVKSIGLSFITKHTRYWLIRTLGNDALPIFDSIMANNLMVLSKSQNFSNLKGYWDAMTVKAKEHSVSLVALERQLFHYFID